MTYCDRRWFRVTTTDFIYPGGPLKGINATISCIRITDVGYPSRGGGFLIKNGGIGHTSVIIKFNSLWNQPMKYYVEVFGIYPKMNNTRRATLAWYLPTNNPKLVKLMRKNLIATSRSNGFPMFSPIKYEYLIALINRPATLPDGRRYYIKKYGNWNQNKMFIPTVVNYKTFYRTPLYRPQPTLFNRRYRPTTFFSMQSPYDTVKLWGHYARPKAFVDFDRNLKRTIQLLPTTVKTTTDCMQVFDYKKH